MATGPDDLPATGFNDLLHALRGRELQRTPGGAGTVVSGGCFDRYHFDWFAENYPTEVTRHIAVELFRDAPPDLPPGAEFVRGSIGDLAPIPDASADLVFAGQVIEHVWADDLAGFLVAAHRILRPGGVLVVDSPNRDICARTGWHMPEHTLELTVPEAKALFELAGFAVTSMRGVWLCADPTTGAILPLDPEPAGTPWPARRRADEATDHPELSFTWWAECRRGDRPPDPDAVRAKCRTLFAEHRPHYFSTLLHHDVGIIVPCPGERVIAVPRGTAGWAIVGPYVALPPGEQRAVFTFETFRPAEVGWVAGSTVAAVVDVAVGEERRVVARREVRVADLPRRGERVSISLPFDLDGTTFGGETRVRVTGAVPVAVVAAVVVEPASAEPEQAGDRTVKPSSLPRSGLAVPGLPPVRATAALEGRLRGVARGGRRAVRSVFRSPRAPRGR